MSLKSFSFLIAYIVTLIYSWPTSLAVCSNDHLDDMVNQEIERLKDFIKKRPANLTTGSATMEEELYDAQVGIFIHQLRWSESGSNVLFTGCTVIFTVCQ